LYAKPLKKGDSKKNPWYPEEGVLLIISEALHQNKNPEGRLNSTYEKMDVGSHENLMAICSIIAYRIGKTCNPPIRLPPRPLF